MRTAAIILVAALCFSSCRSVRKEKTQTAQSEQKTVNSDLTLADDSHLAQTISEAITRAINERLNLSIKKTVFDTDKPTDPITGKPPVKEETDLKLRKERETKEQETTEIQTDQKAAIRATDKGKTETETKTNTQTKSQTEKQSGGAGDTLVSFALLALTVAGLILYLKNKFRR